MEQYTIRGHIHEIMPLVVKSVRFSKQELILKVIDNTAHGTFTEYIRFQCINDIALQLADVQVKDMVIIRFKLRGRKFEKDGETEYYTNNNIDDIAVLNSHTTGPTEIKAGTETDYSDILPGLDGEEPKKKEEKGYDDLPF